MSVRIIEFTQSSETADEESEHGLTFKRFYTTKTKQLLNVSLLNGVWLADSIWELEHKAINILENEQGMLEIEITNGQNEVSRYELTEIV